MKTLALGLFLITSVVSAQDRPSITGTGDSLTGAGLDLAGYPIVRRATVVIPADRVATLFSSPVTLVDGQTHKILALEAFHVRKTSGTAWTTTGSGTLRITFTLGSFVQEAAIFDQATTTTFFGASEAIWCGLGGKGQFQALGNSTGANAIDGAGLRLSLGTADISAGTGSLIVTVWYRIFDGLSQ